MGTPLPNRLFSLTSIVKGLPPRSGADKHPWHFLKSGRFSAMGFIFLLLLSFFTQTANAGYNINNGYGSAGVATTFSCTSQPVTVCSNYYTKSAGLANTSYTVSLSGGSNFPSGFYITIYWDNNGTWTPLTAGANTLTFSFTSTQLTSGSDTFLVGCNNGTANPPAWAGGTSAVLNYVMNTPTTPGIAQNPTSGSQVCVGNGVTYTASGITVGSFSQFLYGWGAAGSNPLGLANGGSWTSNTPGSTLYVEAQSVNGTCTANSSAVTVLVNAASVLGSWDYPTLYYCQTTGGTYNAAGTQLYQGITGNTGGTIGWQYGYNCGGWSAVTQSNSTTCPWNCCFPVNPNSILATVQNGVCPAVTSCYTYTGNGTTAPSTATVTPSLVCTPTSGNITLTYSGGTGGAIAGGVLNWYSGSCGGTYLGSGQSLRTPAPASTTNYFASWVDVCGTLSGCASCTYTVTALPVVSAASYSICMGGSTTLSPTSGGTWVSNNTSAATVSGYTVTPAGPGSATFTFTTSAAPNCANTTSAVSVTAIPVVSVTGPTSFCGTTTTTLSPTGGGTWVSNNTAAATVSGYTVTGTTAGGSANFTFTSSALPDCANTTSSVNVTGLPIVYGITGGGTYCLGSSAPVGLSNSQAGVTYQLVLNGSTNVGSPVTGTGSAISFPNQTVLGTYTVVATTVTNSCPLGMSGSAIVTTLSPNVTNSPGGTGASPTGGTLNGTD
jgi:hypothetical protein